MAITINGDSGISGVDGSAATPALQGTDTNTGISFGTDEVNINTGGTTRAKVDSSGRILVGTSSGTGNSGTRLVLHDSATPRLRLTNSTTGEAATDGGEISLNTNSNFIIENRESAATVFVNNGSERARILPTGGITFNGDTAAANALDDYEEGTFLPTVYGTSTAGTATYAAQLGQYTKIGRLVTVEVYLNWSGGTGSGELRLGGLPFTHAAATYASISIGMVDAITISAGTYLTGYVENSNAYIVLQTATVGGGANNTPSYDAAGRIMYSAQYIVA